MRHRSATIIVASLAVVLLLGGAIFLLVGRNDDERGDSGTAVGGIDLSNATKEDQAVWAFYNMKRTEPPGKRVVLLGNSMVGIPADALSKRLEDGMKLPVTVDYGAAMTSTDAIGALLKLFTKPPRYLVVDIGRYDSERGIDRGTTLSNISMVTTKAAELGVKTIVIGGIGSDGDINFSAAVRSGIGSSALFVDASPLLLDPDTRTSPLELNIQGAAALATMVQKALAS